jgi:hypothetical protein
MNDCNCTDCKPKKIRDYFIYMLPSAVILLGILQLSIGTIVAGIGLSYIIKRLRKLETKVENSECWY